MTFPKRFRAKLPKGNTVVEFYSRTGGRVISSDFYKEHHYSDDWIEYSDTKFWEPVEDDRPKFENHPNHTRFLKVTFTEDGVEKTMDLEVRYLGESNADNGCMLDKIVMPAIKERLGVN